MRGSYADTRSRLTDYFDRTAAKSWEALTSDAPVSRIRQTVREGRDQMREMMLSALPTDMRGARVLDAGCGTGVASVALAVRGAEVVAVDLSPATLDVARRRTPDDVAARIDYRSGDMLDAAQGHFDFIFAMDSLIHYRPADAAGALAALTERTGDRIVFTIAPKTPLLSAMHMSGKLFPRRDRSPAIVPTSPRTLEQHLAPRTDALLRQIGRVSTGFYISQAMVLS